MKNKTREIIKVKVCDVVPDTAQPRQDWDNRKKELITLQNDIEKSGLYYPIIVSPYYVNDNNEVVIGKKARNHEDRKWWILDGERRWRCYNSLNYDEIEAIVRTELTMLEMMEIQFASNTKRLQVTIREMSKAVQRYRDEYIKQNSEYDEREFIKSLCSLTGYSSTYFEMVEAINRSDGDMKDLVLDERVGGYAPFEIEKCTKDPDLRRGVTEAFIEKEGRPLSALSPRAIKHQLRQVDSSLNSSEKVELAKQIMNDFSNRNKDIKDTKPNFLLYQQKANMFRAEIKKWNLIGLKPKEISVLVGVIQEVYDYFLEDRRLNNQIFAIKQSENIIGKTN